MLIIESILGNIRDKQWQDRAGKAKVDYLTLNQWDAQKYRLRRTSEQGNDIAVSLPRNTFMQNGDVLAFDEASNTMTVAKINLRDVLIIEFKELLKKDQSELVRLCIEIGHALGNQHWPAVVKEGRVYVPLTVDRKVMESVMRTHSFEHIHYGFMPGAGVIPYLAPHETRRLFGGADSTPHSHVTQLAGESEGARMNLAEHDHCHEHPHQHDDGTEHAHPHEHTHQHLQSGDDHHHAEVHGNFTPHRHDH